MILSEILVYDGALYIAEHTDDARFDLLLVCSLLTLYWFYVYALMQCTFILLFCGTDGSEKPKRDSKDLKESESVGAETQTEIVKHNCNSASKGT